MAMSLNQGVRVINKAGAVIEALAAARGSLTVAQIAEAVHEPRTTIYRLVGTLQEMGWVEEATKRGRYVLGLRLVELGRASIEHGFERRAALPVLRALRNETGLTVYLTVLRGLRAVCVERMDGREILVYGLQFGGSLPLHAGAGPNVLLAFSDPVVFDRFKKFVTARGEADALTQRTLRRISDLEVLVRQVRHNGYAVSSETNTAGIAAIAAPVIRSEGHCVAAVSIAGSPEDVLDPRRQATFVRAVRQAGYRIAELTENAARNPRRAHDPELFRGE